MNKPTDDRFFFVLPGRLIEFSDAEYRSLFLDEPVMRLPSVAGQTLHMAHLRESALFNQMGGFYRRVVIDQSGAVDRDGFFGALFLQYSLCLAEYKKPRPARPSNVVAAHPRFVQGGATWSPSAGELSALRAALTGRIPALPLAELQGVQAVDRAAGAG